jgi:hypothetical protein
MGGKPLQAVEVATERSFRKLPTSIRNDHSTATAAYLPLPIVKWRAPRHMGSASLLRL